MRITIHTWADLPINASKGKWQGLLLGNGASMALSPKSFGYASLFDAAVAAGKLPTTQPIFHSVVPGGTTTDFEHVLYALSHAKIVNDALCIPSSAVAASYEEVRNALIETVEENHCEFATVRSKLVSAGDFAATFDTVVTLNYDLTLYWAMQLHRDQHGTWLKDGFVSGRFVPDWQDLRRPYGGAKGATLVFFAHGSLILATGPNGIESKVVVGASSPSLSSAIGAQWALAGARPLFISEGDSAAKLQAIRRSHYLSLVYDDVLSDFGKKNVVAYGLSFHDRDAHILAPLAKNPPARLAVAVYTANPVAANVFCHHVHAATADLQQRGTVVEFFDSASPGCWCH